MKVIIKENYDELSKEAAKMVEKQLRGKKNSVLGLATGATPLGTYKELVRLFKDEDLSFKDVSSFNLDEYIGLDENNENSYRYFMSENLFKLIDIKKENTYVPNGMANNPIEAGMEYDRTILENGGIDLQILGIGSNGHIAFNEPAKSLSLGTTLVRLAKATIQDNARFFDNIKDVPTEAITMGIGSIMRARKIILLASGKNKADIIGKLLNSPSITTNIPASLLLLHPNVTIICDKDAYSRVNK
ncbi:MAG: glucosamine-6-phosphate deaminase [Gudongella sp.]|nr:glucosamine-6-phosphate deaminase [Gudongella sp.]